MIIAIAQLLSTKPELEFCAGTNPALVGRLRLSELQTTVPAGNNVLEADVQMRSVKKVFLKFSQNAQENTCARVSFLIKLQT